MAKGIMSIKRGMAVLLSACMVFGMTPIQAGAEGTESDNVLSAESNHYENGFCVNGKVENGIYVHNADCSYGGCCGYEPAVLKEKVTFYDTYKSKDVTLPSAYEIANAGQLYWFAGVVNGDKNVCKGGVEQNTGVNAILTADITINQNVLTADGQLNETDKSSFLKWTPIGGGDNVFYGAINGNHHVIRGLYADENRDYVGLIGNASTYINYGTYSSKYWVTVEQLGIEDSYIKGNNYVGALAGVSYGSVYSCYNTGTVVATGKYAGGIQGKIVSNSTYYDYTYCYNRGSITGTDYVGGITGHFSGKMAHMHNCYNTGRVIGQGSNVHMIAGWVDTRSTSNISDCYYDNSRGADDTYATGLNAGAFASGEAAYLLNIYNKKKQTVRFRQTIGTDLYPVLTTGSKEVYAQAVVNCDGTSSEESRYTNEQIDESVQYTAHKIDAFGICTVCGKYAEPQKSADGYYEITNAGNLYWFAGRVNGGSTTINARIMNDIVVNEGTFTQTEDGTLLYNGKEISDSNKPRIWTPIGGYSNSYGGVIDGQYHTISGLYNGQCIDYAGFLGDCWGEVKNLGVINSCFVTKYGSCNVGGIAGTIRDSAVLYNCYFQGILMPATLSTYGLIGRVQSTSDKSCILNCYYCIDSQNIQSYQGIEKVSVEELVSGEAAWRLNQNNITYKYNNDSKKYELMKDSKMVWGQILTGENQSSYPSAYQESLGNAVYRNVSKYQVCEHLKEPTDYADEKNANRVMEYSFGNGNTQTKPEFVDKGFVWNANDKNEHVCSVCGSVQGHVIVYSVKDNHTIKAGCLYDDNENRGSLTLTAPDYPEGENAVTYDGSAKEVKVENTIEGVEPKVTYTYQAAGSETTETLSEGVKPMNAGSYTASVSLTGADNNTATVSVTFTIEQATPVIAWAENQTKQSAAYTGDEIDSSKLTAPTVTLLGNDTFSDSSKITYSYRKVTDGKASGDFISGLPADIGTYEIKASIPAEGNYTEAETADTMLLTIAYLDNAPDAVVTDKNNKTYHSDAWCPSDIVLKAPDGYKISMEVKGGYEASCTYTGSKENETITYYLKADKSGEIAEKSVTVKMDWTAPDFSSKQSGINIRKNWWNSLLSTITFGLYKGNLDVNIKADDSQSGVAEYYYYIDNSGSTTVLTAEELDTKTFTKVDAGKNGTTKLTEVTSDNDYVIYAYAVDAVGNKSGYICSDGFVLDNTAPKLTNVSVPAESNGTLSDTSATITFTGSEAGTYYYILKEAGESAPTKMSDFATKTAGDKVDTWTAADGVSTGTLTVDEGNTITLTKLKANTGYILYLAATDAAGNASVAESKGADGDSGVVSASFTTAKTIPYVKTAPVLSGNYGDTVSAMLEKADKTKASVTAGLSSDTKIEGTWTLASEDADEIPTVGTSEKYTLTFTPTGSDADTYDPVTCEVTPEVSKKPVTIVIADKEKIYGEANPALTWNLATGDAYADNVLVADDTKEALGISLSTTVQDNSNVGTYAITGSSDSTKYAVSFTGSGTDSKSGVLTVKQAANEFTTELNCSDHTYAKDKTPEPNATAKFGTVTYKYATAALDGTAYKAPSDASAYTDAIPVNAGIYAVKAYVAETDNYTGLTSDPVVFTINKAASPNIGDEEKSYTYAAGSDDKAISVDIAGKLPTDRGTTAYALTNTYNEQLLSDVAVDQDGKLTYKVKEADESQVGATAKITVTASMLNYEDAVYTMTIRITDKKLVTLKSGNKVSVNGSNALTYGDKLSKLGFSDVTFVDADTNTEVKGTLEWADPDCIPTAGTTQAGWVFKPADSKHYEELTGTAAITVARATPAVVTVPTVAEREYNPAVALADSDMTGGSVTGADGNELAGTWSFTGTNIIPTVNNKGYQAVFTPDDTDNYKTVTKTITVKVTKATPVIAEKPTAGALTYGQKLSDSTLTGGKAAYQTADGTEITGTFAWKNSSIKPTAADSQKTEYDVTFTPSYKDNYNAVDTKLTLTVNKVAQAPNMPQAAMVPAHSTKKVGDITLPDGWSWQEDDKDTALADGVAVTANAIYTGTDKGNYETESVSITITRSECEHKNTEIINKKDATCSVEGYTGDTLCKDCGETLASGTTIEKKPHTVGTSATCVSKAVCSVCGETFGEVDASNHVHTTVKNLKEATCTQTGYTGDTYCADCNKLLGMGKELAALGHSYTSKVTKAATTTEEGIMTYTCSKCGHSYTQPIAKIKIDDGNEDNSTSIKPYIKDDSGKEGWDVIKPQLENAKSGETVTVVMNGTSVVPKTVIDSIKGKDTTFVLDMGNGLSWKINGKEITDAAGDIDFGVTIGADAGKSIPVDVINKVSGEKYSMNLSLAYDGEFGFTATLTVNMEPKNSDMYANLFYYNEQTGKLEFISAGQIDSDGNVELAFTHASDYTIVVAANIMSDNSQAANNADETIPSPKTDDSISKYAWNNTMIIIIGICIILIVFGAVLYVRKKSGSEEE